MNTSQISLSDTSCQNCRSKKVKCDRVLPTCTRCETHSVGCVYRERLRSGPKKRKIDLPLDVPMKQSQSMPTVSNSSNTLMSYLDATTPESLLTHSTDDNINMSIFDIIPMPAVQILFQFYTTIPEYTELGLTKEYMFSLLHAGKCLLVSGILAMSCYFNMEYKKYYDNVFKFFQYQIIKCVKKDYDSLEYLQAKWLYCGLQFMAVNPKGSLATITECINDLQFSDYHILDLIPDDQKDLPVTTVSDGCFVNDQLQINNLKRRLYWCVFECDRYSAFGTALSGKLRPEHHRVDLPDSRLNMNHLASIMFGSTNNGISNEFVKYQCKPLSILEYSYILLSKSEEIALWFKKLDYIKRNKKAKLLKDNLVTEYHTYRIQLEQFESTIQFSYEELRSFRYFARVEMFLVCLKIMIRQSLIEVFEAETPKGQHLSERLREMQKEIISIILTIKDKFKVEDLAKYHYEPFLVFLIYELLKILANYSQEFVTDENLELASLTDGLVTIITKLAYEYENNLCRKILDDYNMILERSIIYSLFHFEGLETPNEHPSRFQDFINVEMYS